MCDEVIAPSKLATNSKKHFIYGDERIEFECVIRSNVTTQSKQRILIKVHPNGKVVVSVPEQIDEQSLMRAVNKRSRWIYQKLRDFRAQSQYATPREYVSGESHLYLGKQYMLKVIHAPDATQNVKLLRGKIEVSVRQYSPEKVKQLLDEWYKTRAKEVFAKRLDVVLEKALWVESRPAFRILTMQTQWGSCSPTGRLTLNPHLVKTPNACIDYVILHELCHLAEHNHSKRFYMLLGQVMPDWERVKIRLDGLAHRVLI
ncbi:MAG: M48 family metallopeptidase [Burkholderiales bacterium]|nr:M48 family metallopeptidase [Burkholderiales bacterium]